VTSQTIPIAHPIIMSLPIGLRHLTIGYDKKPYSVLEMVHTASGTVALHYRCCLLWICIRALLTACGLLLDTEG
jgi:hypothetical protein